MRYWIQVIWFVVCHAMTAAVLGKKLATVQGQSEEGKDSQRRDEVVHKQVGEVV